MSGYFFRKLKHSPIGIDMGTTSLKVSQILKKGDKEKIVYADAKIKEEISVNSEEERIIIFKPYIKEVLKKEKFVGKDAVISLPSHDVDFRQLILDSDEEKSIEQILEKEISSLPYPKEEAVVDYIDMGETAFGGGKRRKILMMSARKRVVQNYINVLKEAKLNCVAVDLLPFALFRAIKKIGKREKSPLAVIDIGFNKSRAVVYNNDNFVLHRTIPVGSNHFVKSIEKELEVSNEDSQRYLFDYGIGEKSTSLSFLNDIEAIRENDIPSLIKDIIKDDLEKLSSGIEEIFRYCSAELRGVKPSSFILCGGGAKIKNLSQYFHQRFQIDVSIWCPNEENNSSDKGERKLTEFAVAYGLALRGEES
ncbi:MAG: hypothetical protein D6734_05080 [Candidatus Schekmanbacteria bacterium]|nr:MAG: hypothetical protein D6734_05080 [Candidatus Schekmanbacteria bacterium]